MSRRLLAAAGSLALAGAQFAAPARAQVPARPNPALVSVQLDYVNPLPSVAEAPGRLAPLSQAVSAQAVADETYLRYRTQGDLGGFLLAPVGGSAIVAQAREIVGGERHASQIPQYGEAADGVVRSFAFIGGPPGGSSENGRGAVPGLGSPPRLPLPANSNSTPPPNEGFGGRGLPEGGQPSGGGGAGSKPGGSGGSGRGGSGGSGGGEAGKGEKPGGGGKAKHHPAKEHPPVTTPTETPGAAGGGEGGGSTGGGGSGGSGGGAGGGGGGSGGGGASCGTVGLSIVSDHSTCRIYAVNMAPGRSASEVMTVRDEAGVPVTLSLRASGEENRFWNDLRMGVWQVGTAAPDPLPELLWWTTQDNRLTTLSPEQQVSYEIELYLPTSAGNEDQGQAAIVDLTWHAQQ